MKDRPAADRCPVCATATSNVYARHRGIDVLRCGDCGTAFVSPLPEQSAVRAMNSDAYAQATAGYFAKTDKKMRHARGRIRLLRRYALGVERFLDVGCSGGFLVEAARATGLDATGIDLDPVSIAYAREHYAGNRFFRGTVEEFAGTSPGSFDVVHASEVIEHVPDVRSFAAALSRLLRPGGVLYITTPDITHWRRPRNLARWDAFTPPAHCIFFNPISLAGLLDEFGLGLVRRRFAWKPGIKLICRKRAT